VAIGGQEVTELRPVKVSGDGNALNKAGRLVVRGHRQGSAIKIYEAANARHAEFIAAACNHSHLASCFPPVRVGCGRFLIANWAEDLRPSGAPVEVLVRLLHQLHQTPVHELPEAGFDYWHDYIKPRFRRATEFLGSDVLADEVIALISRAWGRTSRFLTHPDLTPRNVVLNSARRWQIIDNELLSIGGMPLLDMCNTAYPLGAAGQTFVDGYLSSAKASVSEEDIGAVNAAWLARRTGTAFVAGDLGGAKRLIDRYRSGEIVLPVTLTATTGR
jgi:aminoglycoside phosphotransferase (APT) family kinase protein